jgi:hypothetical protein
MVLREPRVFGAIEASVHMAITARVPAAIQASVRTACKASVATASESGIMGVCLVFRCVYRMSNDTVVG